MIEGSIQSWQNVLGIIFTVFDGGRAGQAMSHFDADHGLAAIDTDPIAPVFVIMSDFQLLGAQGSQNRTECAWSGRFGNGNNDIHHGKHTAAVRLRQAFSGGKDRVAAGPCAHGMS